MFNAFKNLVKNNKKIPGPPDVPFLGNLWRYKFGLEEQSKYHEALKKLNLKYGPVVRQRLGTETVIHLFNPDDASTIYAKETRMPEIKPLQETIQIFRKNANASLGLGNSNGEEWYKLRSPVKPIMLTRTSMDHFIPGSDKATDELINHIKLNITKDHSVPRLMTLFGAWSIEAACSMCFGKRMGYLKENMDQIQGLLRANRSIFYMTTHLKFSTSLYRYINLPKWKCLEASEKYILSQTNKHTNETIDKLNKSLAENNKEALGGTPYVVKDLFKNETLSRNDIQVIIQSLLTDSLSTTVPVLTFCLYILATQPNIQKRAYEEVSKLVNKDSEITAKTMDSLYYIKGLIKESLRLYPNGTEVSRILHNEHNLSGCSIPPKTHVHINMGAQLRSEKEFPRASDPLPERWIRSESTHKSHPFVLTPFGHGTRTCMGRRFAEQTLQIAIAKFVLNFQINYKEDVDPIEQIYNILIFPTDARGLTFVPRN